MAELNRHWTERDVDSFLYRIGADFIRQLQKTMIAKEINQAELAGKLKVTEGRVSQVLNNPGNLTLRKIIQYARALDHKVSVVAYDDGDPNNQNGPVSSEILEACWQRAGRPRDFFALAKTMQPHRDLAVQNRLFYFTVKPDQIYPTLPGSHDWWNQYGTNSRTIQGDVDYETEESSTAATPLRM